MKIKVLCSSFLLSLLAFAYSSLAGSQYVTVVPLGFGSISVTGSWNFNSPLFAVSTNVYMPLTNLTLTEPLLANPTISAVPVVNTDPYFILGVPDPLGGLVGIPDYVNINKLNVTNLTISEGIGGKVSITNPIIVATGLDGLPIQSTIQFTNFRALYTEPASSLSNTLLINIPENGMNHTWIRWNAPTNDYFQMNWWPDHDGFGNPEMVFDTSGSLAFAFKWMQLGVESLTPSAIYLQNMRFGHSQSSTNLRDSIPIMFTAKYYSNDVARCAGSAVDTAFYPALHFRAADTNGNGDFGLYSRFNFAAIQLAGYQQELEITGNVQQHHFQVGPNPHFWFSGGLKQEREAVSYYSTQPLSFSGFQYGTIELTGDTTFYTTNRDTSSSIAEQRIFILKSDVVDADLTWPAGWKWLSGSCASNQLPVGNWMRLQLESIGEGESNILAFSQITTNIDYAWDSDATNYIARANVTGETEKRAFNVFVSGLKSANIWTNLYALWPLYGADTNYTEENLISTNYSLVWKGDLTDPAYHSTMGVTNTGTAGSWADTQFNPTTVGVDITNFHTMVWCQSTNGSGTGGYGGSSGCALGASAVSPVSYSVMLIGADRIMYMIGPYFNGSAYHAITNAADLVTGTKGFVYTSSDASGNAWFKTVKMQSGPSGGVGVTNLNMSYSLFAQQYSAGNVDNICSVMLSGASLGKALTTTQRETYNTLWSQLQTYLGRQ